MFDFSVQLAKGIDSDTHTFILQPGVALKPAANMFVSLTPSYIADEDAAQYVEAVTDPTATAFCGNRYVFAFIKTRTLSLDTRVNWTFTPNLTLQLFAQPFFASGAYSSFREFAAPRIVRKLDVRQGHRHDLAHGRHRDEGRRTRSIRTAAGPAPPFTFGDPDFTYRSLRGNAVLRWEYRPGSTVFFVWTQQRTGSDTNGDFDFSKERTADLPRPANERVSGQGKLLARQIA